MIDGSLLLQLQQGVQTLLRFAGKSMGRSSETDTSFSLRLTVPPADLKSVCMAFSPYSDVLSINLECQIQHGSGAASVTRAGLFSISWSEDHNLTAPELEPSKMDSYARVADDFSSRGRCLDLEKLEADILRLADGGASTSLALLLFMDKESLLRRLGLPEQVRGMLYVSTEKFLQKCNELDLPDLGGLLVPNAERAILLMLGNASGACKGPRMRALGKDEWTIEHVSSFPSASADTKTIQDAIQFRNDECHWETPALALTPYHLFLEYSSLDKPEIPELIARLRDRCSVAYLADSVLKADGSMVCRFKGLKQVSVAIPPLSDASASVSLYNLFTWAYENSSSDKLGIVRQLVSLQLSEGNASLNYLVLSQRASEILGIAKSNFQLFLQRAVGLYFDKRFKMTELVGKFSQEVDTTVSAMTKELLDNLYKTLGAVVGVAIGTLVGPKQASFIIWLASSLYFLYIVFLLIQLGSFSYMRFRAKALEYHHNINQLRDVLSKDEIERLQGKSYGSARVIFLAAYTFCLALYASLGAVAYLLLRYFSQLL